MVVGQVLKSYWRVGVFVVLVAIIIGLWIDGRTRRQEIEGYLRDIRKDEEVIHGLRQEVERERARSEFWEAERRREAEFLEELGRKVLEIRQIHERRLEGLERLEVEDSESADWFDLPVPAAIRGLFFEGGGGED